MRYTLLEATQLILSALDGDEVNSYSDTTESLQVAQILKSIYYDLATDLDLPSHETLFELDASGDSLKPTLMTVPSNVCQINWIKYNNKLSTDTNSNYRYVEWMDFETFSCRQNALYTQSSDIAQMSFTNNGETFEMMYKSNAMPLFYTSMDNYTLIFDSYDADEDTTLQKSKTQCHGSVYPSFTLSDSFTPDLDPTQFSLWLNAAKTRAFAELKQAANQESAAYARRQRIVVQKRQRTVEDYPEVLKVPRYGRGTPMTYSTINKKLKQGM